MSYQSLKARNSSGLMADTERNLQKLVHVSGGLAQEQLIQRFVSIFNEEDEADVCMECLQQSMIVQEIAHQFDDSV
jgi:hypothetical protein